MSGELNMFVTSVTSSGPHIKFYAQLHTEKYAALDSVISANQNQFDVSTLSSPYELKPGELVLVKSLTGASAKWHRARVNNIQSIEYGTVAIQFIDYGTNEVVHYSQICTSMNPVAASILAQPPLAVECVLADVVPALAIWADAAISFAESKLLFQVVRGQLVRQDGPDGPLHVRAYGADGVSLAQQLAALGLGRPAQTGAVPPGYQTGGGYGATGHPSPSATPPQPTEFAVRVKEMTTAPAQPGSELPVTVCHYSNGPAKFAIQNHQQRDTLRQLMADIQAYCQTSRPAPVPMLEPGAVCLGASASRDGQFLRGVITQVDGGLVKVYWADFGHDETKSAGELRAMPRQFVGPWIQASRVSLAGLEGLVAAPSAAHTFRELTDGRLLTCRFRGKDQPNQVDLYDRDQSVLDQLLQLGAYTMPGASSMPPRGAVPQPTPLQHPAPSRSPAAAYPPPSRSPAAAAPSGPVLTPGSTSEVLVVEVGAVNNLYVRVAASEGQLNQLLHQLAEQLSAGGQQLPPSSCRVGTLCAVRKQDGGYQRARVVSLGRRDLKVQYVDVGSSELVPLQAVLALDQRFATLPPQAFHCCLEGLETTHGSAEHVRQLQAITANARLLCIVVSQPAADRRVVRLTDPRRQPALDVNAMMREAVAAAGPPPTQQGQLIRDSGPAAPAVSGPPVEPGRREQLVVMHVESPARWFGQLAKLDADALAAMEEAMQSRYTQGRAPPPLSSAPLGTHCAAFSAVHEAIFRAKVVSRQGTQVTVFFIDYGDTEETSVAKLFPLLQEFTQLPQLGISCALRGAEAVPPDTFRSVLLNQTVDVLLHSPRPGPGTDIYDVSLAADSAVNRTVMEQLVPAGLRTAPEGGSTPQPQRRPAAGASLTLPQQQLPVGVYKEVEVVHVVSPAEFYVQLKEQFPAIDAVQEQVAGYASAPPPSAAPVSGALVAALYPDDGLWYRGRVMSVDASGKATVFFVDYGDTRALSASEVRPLRPEHASLAGQAIRCCSSDVGRHGRKDFTEQETASFRSAVLEVPYLARCEETRAGTAVVTLAKAELLEPVLDAPASAVPPPVTRQISGEQRKPPPRADMDPNWRERPAGGVTPTSPPAGDPFSGRMRMDQPESYSRPQRSSRPSGDGWGSGGGDGWGSGGGGGGGGGSDGRSGGGRERSWQGHDDRGSEERGWGGGGGGGSGGGGSGDSRGPRGAPDGAGARQADSWSSGGRQDRAPAAAAGAGGGPGGRPGSGRTRTGAGGGDDWSSNSSTTSGGGGGARQPTPAVSIPEHSARLTYTALRPGAELRAAPTWVCGLHEFFVQPLDGAEPFSKLMTEMQTFYGGLRRPQDGAEPGAAAGRPVAARFTDGAWYRAVVTKCAPTELAVHFVDYGNSATVDRRLVKRLKEEYCRLPPQAYRCQFGGVKPVGGKWKVLSEKELAKYFADEIQVTCLSAEGALSLVEVTLAASGQRATDQLVAAGLAERPAAARPLQQSDIGPFPPLERAFAAGERVEVFVACVLSPSRLYIQLSENTEQIEQMAADIEKSTADCQVPCPDVSTGEICLAPFEGVYYRGVITAVEGQNANIYFVDYGNTERIDVGELVECPMHLVDLPAQAIQCSMTGVPASCGPQLAATVDQMELTALVDRVLPGSLVVTLLSGGKNINLQLGGDGQARSPEPVTGKTTASVTSAAPAAAPLPAAAAVKTQAAPAAAVATASASAPFSRVTVSYAESPDEFYVQDSADGPAAQLDEVMAKLETEYAQLAPEDRAVTQVQTGDLVAAPFADDGVFYRARLLSAEPSAAECQLQFIDYGNCQLTPRGQLKRLTPELLAPAPLAQRCRLPERPAGASGWTDEHTERFEQLAGTLEKVLQLRRVEEGADGVWTVRLLDGAVDVGQELVKAGCALPPEEKTPAASAAAPAAAAPAAAAEPAARPTGPAGLARLKKGCLLEAAVVFALSPTDFWVQLSADIATLDDLMARLESAQLTPAPAPAVGHLLVARYAEDEALYRARVLSTAPDGGATVLFVDYGNKETVPAGELWSCPPDLATTPPLAVRCSLPLEPQPWSDDAVEKFSELVGVGGAEERTLNLELVRTGDPAIVNLFYEQQDVAFEMVGAGFGNVHVEERPTPVRETPPAEKPASSPVAEPETTTATAESETPAPTEESSDSAAAAAAVAAAPAGEELVLVSHVNSPLEFYVQAADTAPLDDLMERLTIEFESAEPVSEVKPGTLAAAPYSEDGAPYRARVLSVQDDTARVLFVDYGNSESVPVSDLRQLSGELAAITPQARPCQLDVEACQEEAADRLRELAEMEEPVTMRQLAAGAVSRVKLTLPAGDAAGMLVNAGLCQQRAGATLPAPPPPPSAPVRLLVSHVDSPACFFVQLRREMAALDELADLLAELYDTPAEPPLPLAAPCCGDLCVARIPGEDGGWFRAHVERVTGAGEVHVRLADYGSTAAAAEVRTAAPAVCRAPAMALRCRLPARPAEGAEWSQEAAAALAELVDAAGHRLDARLVPDPAAAAGSPLVALLSHQGRSVTLMLQEQMKEQGVEMIPEPLAAEGVTVETEERTAREEKASDAQTAEQVTKRMDDLTLTETQEEQSAESADNTTAPESAENTEEGADGSHQGANESNSDDDASKPAEDKVALDENEKPGGSEEPTGEKSDETKTDTSDEQKSPPDTEDAEAGDMCPPKSPEPPAPTPAAETEGGDDTPAPAEADDDAPAPAESDGDTPAPIEGDKDTPAPVEDDKDTPAPSEGTEDDENVVGGDGDKPAPAESSGETPAPAAETDSDGDKPASDEGGDSSASVAEIQGSGDAPAAAEDGDDTSPPSADASAPAEGDAKATVTEGSGGDRKTPGPAAVTEGSGGDGKTSGPAAVTEGSGGDAPGNGHASPVNGREGSDQHGDAPSAGGKAVSAGRESPDAADGAQAAA